MSYSADVIALTPSVYYRLGEASGDFADSSGNARTMTTTDDPTFNVASLIATDGANGAARFDGASDYCNTPAWGVDTVGALTVMAWVKCSTPGAGVRQIAGRGTGAASYISRLVLDGGVPKFSGYNTSSTAFTADAGASIADGSIHFLVGTVSGTTVSIYVDGVLAGTTATITGTQRVTSQAFRVGGHAAGENIAADLDEVAAWSSVALSPAQIAALYASGLGTVAVGRASETDLAQPITVVVSQIVAVGRASETDLARAVTVISSQIVTVGRATETDTARPAAAAQSRIVGRASETDAAVPIVEPQFATVGRVVEISTAQPINVIEPPRTEINNRTSGRVRLGIGYATWSPAVALPPASAVIVHHYLKANAYSTPTISGPGRPTMIHTEAEARAHLDRIVVGGVDVTYFRDVETPLPSYRLIEPLLYGSATLVFPQIAACFETPGEGDLSWLRTGKTVKVERVDVTTNEVVATDYVGFIVAFDVAGADLSCELGGQAAGRAALRNKQVPLFRNRRDVGARIYDAIHALGLPIEPYLGTVTGITTWSLGGMSHLDYINQLHAMAVQKDLDQFTTMPDADGVYRTFRKDTETIHATVYLDDARAVGSLRRDLAEEPNRIFATGVTPEGQKVKFGAYPGLRKSTPAPYPMDDDSSFSEGTEDGDTDTGDGITVMIWRLIVTGYLTRRDSPGGYDADVTDAIEALQADAELTESGNMTLNTWRALFDLSATGFSLRASEILPAASRSKVRVWRRSASGSLLGRNPNHRGHVVKVDANIDVGPGFTRGQIRGFARAKLGTEDNWVGTIALPTGAVIAGEHTPGDSLVEADVLNARGLRPGMNIWAPLFMGGTLFHISGIDVSASGLVTLTVDTRARDTMEVWQIIARNRESRSNPARAWINQHRSSTITKDGLTTWDEVGGTIDDTVHVPANQWTVFPVVAGQEGTIARLRLNTNPDAEFVCAVFGRKVTGAWLDNRVANPLTPTGLAKWSDEATAAKLDARILLYVAGKPGDPCGYFPSKKSEGGTLTGRFQDDASFGFRTFGAPVLYVAVYADRVTKIPAGRIMWPQLEEGS